MGTNLMLLTFLLFCASKCVLAGDGRKTTEVGSEHEKKEILFGDCIKTLVHIKTSPLVTTDCCLTMLCSDNSVLKQMTRNHPAIKELSYELCGRNFYLVRELLAGCVFKNNRNDEVNNTNSVTMELNNQSSTPIANCTVKFQLPTVNGETGRINSEITDDFEKRSTEISVGSRLEQPRFNQRKAENLRMGDGRIRFGNITETAARISELQFLDVPIGDEMRIHDLKLDREYLIFEAFSALMTYLQPDGFPLDLLRDVVQNGLPFHLLVFQLLKMEIVAVGWIITWTVLALGVPFVLLSHFCCSSSSMRRLDEEASEISLDFREKCTKRTLGLLLHLLLTLLLIPIIMILAGNEQISKYVTQSMSITNTIFEDINTFIRNTHMQITFVATSSTDITVEAIRNDLEDLEALLGRPFREQLAAETGIDTALDALDQLKYDAGVVTSLVSDLVIECASADAAGSVLQERLGEIAQQLTIARQQCLPKDRVLCYTLECSGLDVTFSSYNLTADLRIKHLERVGKERSFNNSFDIARVTIDKIPEQVTINTATSVAELKTALNRKRSEVYKAAHSLDALARALTDSVMSSHESTLNIVQSISNWEFWRWWIILGISTILSLVWGLLLCGAPCGCGVTSRTTPFLLSGVGLSSLTCLAAWSLGTVSFLVGGHGQALLCRPLYDLPHYGTLGEVLDAGGVLYRDGGFFNAFVKGNGSLRVRDVLKGFQRNHPAYATFHLSNLFDVELTNYKSWEDFSSTIANFTIGDANIEILSPSLQLNLQFLSTTSAINFTKHRTRISGTLTKRDLNSVADQLNTISRQLIDLGSSKRIGNLALMVRRVINSELQRLSDLRDRILYKITALEVLIHPLSRQARRLGAQLKDIQFYLDNQGWLAAEKVGREFTSRIENYLESLHDHVATKVTREIGKCKPLWEIFHSARFCICKLIVSPMNGISFCSFSLILLFLGIVPVVLNLVERYRDLNEELLTSITHRRARDGLTIDNEGTWATPSSESLEVEMHDIPQGSTWVTPGPRQPSDPLIPPPPRLPTITSRISAARVPQIPSVSRARSPKRGRFESMPLFDAVLSK